MKHAAPQGPFILALETATDIASVALFSGEQLLGSLEARRGRSHARLLTAMIQQLLSLQDLKAADLDAVAVTRGPGSYTGLRVGVSTAKGLCMALDVPLLSVNSLEALAWQAREVAKELNAWICPMIDARRMEVYCEIFDADVKSRMDVHARIIEEDAFADILKERRLLFLGDGAAKCAPVLGAHEHAVFLTEMLSTATVLGKSLYLKYGNQEFEALTTFEPFYLKDFVATKPKDPLRR